MSLIDNLSELGLIAQTSAEQALAEHLDSGSRTVYCGFDPTANSLHIGNLVPLLALRRFQLAGHRPILLVGGATGMIGDPGGRDSERELQPMDVVAQQTESIQRQAESYLDFDCGANSAIVVNNMEWTGSLSAIDFLRDVGKHFSINAMIQKESVRRRVEDPDQGISYTEFSYMVLQSYDFVVLNQAYDCTIQMGGSDQWGNITAGIDLIRRMSGNQAHAVTYPLVTKSDGTKFGKSSGGAIWLDPSQTSPFSFYQFWLNAADADVVPWLKLFTFLSREEIGRLESAVLEAPQRREAQQRLAEEVTRLVHGDAALESARRITASLFGGELDGLTEDDLEQLRLDGMDTVAVAPGSGLLSALTESGLAGSISNARKLVQGNGIRVNATLIHSVAQAWHAARAGATFVSPFIGWKDQFGDASDTLIAEVRAMLDNYGFDSEIIASALRNANHVGMAALAGADCSTAAFQVYADSFKNPYTSFGENVFQTSWDKTPTE